MLFQANKVSLKRSLTWTRGPKFFLEEFFWGGRGTSQKWTGHVPIFTY